jgi:hypothetical protein
VLVTNAEMVCNNKVTNDIAYNHKSGDQFKHINVAYHLEGENIDPRWISLLQVESAKFLPDNCTNGLLQVTLQKLRTYNQDAK